MQRFSDVLTLISLNIRQETPSKDNVLDFDNPSLQYDVLRTAVTESSAHLIKTFTLEKERQRCTWGLNYI